MRKEENRRQTKIHCILGVGRALVQCGNGGNGLFLLSWIGVFITWIRSSWRQFPQEQVMRDGQVGEPQELSLSQASLNKHKTNRKKKIENRK